MRLAVISDIHGNLVALEAVLADIKARGADRTVNLGDCVTSPLWPKETFQALQQLSLPTVRGNHDRWIEEFPDDKLSPAGLFAQCIDRGAASDAPQPALPTVAGRRNSGLPRHAR
nr:metallophosphoesterase family protein [Bradyrhizobium diazoefficiens]